MDIPTVSHKLDHPEEAADWLRPWGVEDAQRAHRNLVSMAAAGVTLDLMAHLCTRLTELLPDCPNPDMALNNLDRFVCAARSPLTVASRWERDADSLPILIQIFSSSQYFSDLLIADPAAFEVVRLTEGRPVSRDALINELCTEVLALSTPTAASEAVRRFKRREMLRIGYGDIVRAQPVEVVTRQISYVADTIIEAALRAVRMELEAKLGTPMRKDGKPARFVVLALGKLGGEELNYSSDVDLVFLYDQDGTTTLRGRTSNQEFFQRLAREVVKLLTEMTPLGQAYRVDMRLRPEGKQGPMAPSLESALHYYDVMGRTWERQAYVKARPVAGNLDLGREFLSRLEYWIFRRYLTLADVTGIKALKRRIETRTRQEGDDEQNVKTGHGGIRDVEFVIQFLQLLNAGDIPNLRSGNTLLTIAELENAGCLTNQERVVLEENYRFLRKVEHRLQFMFDLQTHVLPDDRDERRALALRMGFRDAGDHDALDLFETEYRQRTQRNRQILDHLLHDAFPDDAKTEPEVDLMLDPSPSPERIEEVFRRYHFQDIASAYTNMTALATERIRFLSTRRCRLFLASIAPDLLESIAATPDPDQTLVNLVKVSDSLGGKAVLWELFRFNPPSLRLYVELCASSQFLSEILTSSPGMIDELMDSLVLGKLPALAKLRTTLAELCRAAEDLDPILHSFKNSQLLRVGVRDILGKETLESVTGTLSDIAEAVLEQLVSAEYEKLTVKFGEPIVGSGTREGHVCEFVVLAVGKFGGRELAYHSDLDIVFLYEAEGQTRANRRARRAEATSNQHFFSELGQRIIKSATRLGPHGRLYEVDARLRPTGKSGSLAVSLEAFRRYFASGEGVLWERQALCKARVTCAPEFLAEAVRQAVSEAAFNQPWQAGDAEKIRSMRTRLEASSSASNLKRGAGGIVDIEFLVQMLQLQHAGDNVSLRVPSTLDAMAALHASGHLSQSDYEFFNESYRFLRSVESRLRLLNSAARDDLPEDVAELDKLAQHLGYDNGQSLLSKCATFTTRTRERFDELFGVAAR